MNTFKFFSRVPFSLMALLAFSAPFARAESLQDVRARMEQRLSQLDRLKASGAIGENNRGFVESREAGVAGAGELISAENNDREKVYAAIAEKTKTSVDEVGRARARQIATASSPGLWIQDADGSWRKK